MPNEFSFSNARSHLTDIANAVAYKGSRAIITRKGKKLFAMVSIEDLETLQAIEDRIDLDDAKKALEDTSKQGTSSWKAIKQKLNL